MSEVHLEVRSDSRASSLRSSEMSMREIGGSSTATAPASTLTERTLSLTESSYSGELGTLLLNPVNIFFIFIYIFCFVYFDPS